MRSISALMNAPNINVNCSDKVCMIQLISNESNENDFTFFNTTSVYIIKGYEHFVFFLMTIVTSKETSFICTCKQCYFIC